jgi:hypothetical protein
MTCQECEVKLGMGEDAGEHLASCAECRWLAEELRRNAVALREMRAQTPRSPAVRWEWAMAAAAAIVMGIFVWKPTHVERLPIMAAHGAAPQLQQLSSPAPVAQGRARRVKHIEKKQIPTEPLRVKMFTSDPDVVIYWIVDRKEGSE